MHVAYGDVITIVLVAPICGMTRFAQRLNTRPGVVAQALLPDRYPQSAGLEERTRRRRRRPFSPRACRRCQGDRL
jgi:hypothetical protein